MNKEEFIKNLEDLKIVPKEEQLEQLEKYYNLLIEYNKVMNLTGITEKKEVYLKHFYDSLTISKVIDLNKNLNLCDVGTGAGFPGVVLKIFYPNLNITLVDSLQKRINFLNKVILELNLKNIVAIHARVEEFSIKNRNQFDIVTARAVSSLNILLEYCIPITKENGHFVPMKGNISSEINDSKNALKTLNSEIVNIYQFTLPIENSNRCILDIVKKKDNEKYPRKYSEIKKRPL